MRHRALRPLAASTLLGLLLTAPSPAQLFAPPEMFRTPGPSGIVVGDLDGDLKTDIATCARNQNAVSVLNGQGGGFGAARLFPVGSAPGFLACADLDGDGRLDLVTANWDSADVSVLRNVGGAALFAPAQHYGVGTHPTSVAIGDLNGDGQPDLVSSDFGPPSLSVLLNDGSGGFTLLSHFPLPSNPDRVALADFNGDGLLDLATTQRYLDTVLVMLGNGFGWFHSARQWPISGGSPGNLVPADVNNDGVPDLVVTTYKFNGMVNVLLGLGRGAFRQTAAVPVGIYTYAVAVGDVTGDGRPDVIVGDGLLSEHNLYYLRGDGAGHLANLTTIPLSHAPSAIALADCNGDGRRDLACPAFGGDHVNVLFRNP